MNRKLLRASPVAAMALAGILALSGATDQSCSAPTSASADANVSGRTTSNANERLGMRMAAAKGWGATQRNCLDKLWTRESGWNSRAVNPRSGAAGIPQALGHGHVFDLGDPRAQISWGLRYIRSRYGDPCSAWASETSRGWY